MNKRLYRIWRDMKSRCYYQKNDNYKYYGGRGIIVCPEWLQSFKAFEAWAIANGYHDGMTIDRKNTDGNYEPSNCRFITHREQQNNRSNNHLIEYRGQIHNVSQWATIFGIKQCTMFRRLEIGWSMEKIEAKSPQKVTCGTSPNS
jgi:hypothetical protein